MRVIATCLLPLLLISCSGGGSADLDRRPVESKAPALRDLVRGAHSGIRTAERAVLRESSELASLWTRHSSTVNPPLPLPEVDWSTEMVLAVFGGNRPSSGFVLEIVDARPGEAGLQVLYRESTPAATGGSLTVLTQPHHLVAVPRYAGEVEFRLED